MLFNIRLLISFIRKFTIFGGLRLFINFKLKKLDELRIPELKHPFKLRVNTSDTTVFYQIFSDREYDNPIDFTPNVIVDAGANIGLTSLFYANKYPNAKIYSIEPDKENFETLQFNTNNYSNITCLNYGLWHQDTSLRVSDKFQGGKWAMVVEEIDTEEPGSIKAISLNSLISQFQLNQIDILKMDIESAEFEVFSKHFELWIPKTKMMIVELHDRMKPGCSKAFFNAINSSLTNFNMKSNGENFIIYNLDLKK